MTHSLIIIMQLHRPRSSHSLSLVKHFIQMSGDAHGQRKSTLYSLLSMGRAGVRLAFVALLLGGRRRGVPKTHDQGQTADRVLRQKECRLSSGKGVGVRFKSLRLDRSTPSSALYIT